MSAEKRVSKEIIVRAATEIVRKQGIGALNARSIAAKLKCSTRPIYLSFDGMDALKAAVKESVTEIYQSYLHKELLDSVYPPYKAFGMGYIRFAREEKELFRYLFMRDRSGEERGIDGGGWDEVIAAVQNATGLDRERAERFHLESWLYVHGIASALATSYIETDDDTVSDLISDMFFGLKARYGV